VCPQFYARGAQAMPAFYQMILSLLPKRQAGIPRDTTKVYLDPMPDFYKLRSCVEEFKKGVQELVIANY